MTKEKVKVQHRSVRLDVYRIEVDEDQLSNILNAGIKSLRPDLWNRIKDFDKKIILVDENDDVIIPRGTCIMRAEVRRDEEREEIL